MNFGTNLIALTLSTGLALLASSPTHASLVAFQAEDYASVTAPDVGTITSVVDAEGTLHEPVFGSAIYTLGDSSNEPTLTYVVDLAAGDYDLYARVWVPTTDDLTNSANPNNQSRYSNDSFFAPTELGASPADESQINGIAGTAERAWKWINIVDDQDSVSGEILTPYSVAAAGPQTLVIRLRENGLLIDAWAFGTATETYTDEQLNAAIPEPASLALLGVGGLLIAGRRRSA